MPDARTTEAAKVSVEGKGQRLFVIPGRDERNVFYEEYKEKQTGAEPCNVAAKAGGQCRFTGGFRRNRLKRHSDAQE